MPIHDWSRVEKFIFHDFRATWIGMLRSALNTGVLPVGFYALLENASRHRRLTIREVYQHRLVTIVEIIAPDRKDSKEHVQELLFSVENDLASGVNLLIVDLFKPGNHDPCGLPDAIWRRLGHERCIPSIGEPLTITSYTATRPVQAYLDPYAVGQTLRDMPLFLDSDTYVAAPLEATYQTTWRGTPKIYRDILEEGDIVMRTELYWIAGPAVGRIAIMPRPRGGDWLEDEVGGWRRAGVDVVVSLLTHDEVADLDLADEERFCKANGIQFLSYPISDRTVPTSKEAFAELVNALQKQLQKEKSLAIHCRQGIGRAALVAIGLLIVGGVAPETAIQQASAARGCSVPETVEQKNWILEYATGALH